MTTDVLCVGELLWDSLPSGLFLGGAPFNVAAHLHRLGVTATIVSRVGKDRLGEEAMRRVAQQGLANDFIERDDTLPTGFVTVELSPDGVPTYDIVAPAAWDAIALEGTTLARASGARAIVFGSLAQRSAVSRASIRRLGELPALKVFDVNLRPPFEDAKLVRDSLRTADLVKVNEEEMDRLSVWFGLPANPAEACRGLAEEFGCGTVCMTRGVNGATLLREGRWSEHGGYHITVSDTVGAGDAFLAALLQGILVKAQDHALLQHANLLGAFVASRSGALPDHDPLAMQRIAEAPRHEAGSTLP